MENITQMSVDEILNKFSEEITTQTEVIKEKEVEQGLNFKTPLEEISSKSVDDLLNEQEGEVETEVEAKEKETSSEVKETTSTKGRPKDKLEPSELASIQLLIDNGKIQPWVDDKNEIILPSTKQELLELMDENLEIINTNSYQEVAKNFYQTKSPVWQQLLQYSETAKSLDEIAPLFNAMQSMETIEALDIENEAHQEYIIKQHGLLNGLDAVTIDADIEDLKERGKLKERAEKFKPGLEKYNEQQIAQALQTKQQEEKQKQYLLQNHYNNVIENVINKKEISGIKIKDEHRQYVASTLVPDESLGGLPIYTLIDNLLQKGDFETLFRISLLSTDPKIHDTYFNAKVGNDVAEGLKRVLRTANTPTTETATDINNNDQKPKTVNWFDKSKKYI